MKKLAIFCGSRTGIDPIYEQKSREFAKLMVENDLELVYGAGKVGLMGAIANEVLDNNGKVYGFIPYFLSDLEVAHKGITSLTEVDTMHERKQLMANYSDGFVALPGGMGTMDELCEIITWRQLSLHQKPIGILNINGYFDKLIDLMDNFVENGFLDAEDRKICLVSDNPQELIDLMKANFVEDGDEQLGKA
ncbi:MAG: hypothetical protein ACI85I_002816 [Arenicella sp.]|jgi:uncharacterized protein (TIGR00730 family)